MSEDIITLQLRQQEADVIYQNGDYNVELNKPVKIEEGDTIQLFKSFIDTKETTSGRVVLNYDTELNFHYGFWAQHNYLTDQASVIGYPQFTPYVLCQQRSTVTATLESISYGVAEGVVGDEFGGMAVLYQYTDPIDNKTKQITFHFPFRNARISDITIINKKLNYLDGSLQRLTPPSAFAKYGMDPTTENIKKVTKPNPGQPEDIIQPYILSHSITIPKGDYEPSKIAQIITDKLTAGQYDYGLTKKTPIKSPFLKSTGDYGDANDFLGASGFTDPYTTSEYIFVNSFNGIDVYSYNTDRNETAGDPTTERNYWIGASQIALEYLPSGRFEWSYLHTPYIDTDNGNISVSYIESTTDNYYLASANGGIYFQSLSATQNGEHFAFWDEILGFNMDKIIVKYDAFDTPIPAYAGNIKSVKFENMKFGETITKADTSIDIAINKTDTSIPFYQVIPPASLPIVDVSLSDGLLADTPFNENTSVNFGYFMIELNSNYSTKFISQNSSSNLIKGIVSRYYSANSYTSGASDSSITYIHKGEPIYLNNFGVRILDSTGKVANDIGDDNTIFLMIYKK